MLAHAPTHAHTHTQYVIQSWKHATCCCYGSGGCRGAAAATAGFGGDSVYLICCRTFTRLPTLNSVQANAFYVSVCLPAATTTARARHRQGGSLLGHQLDGVYRHSAASNVTPYSVRTLITTHLDSVSNQMLTLTTCVTSMQRAQAGLASFSYRGRRAYLVWCIDVRYHAPTSMASCS